MNSAFVAIMMGDQARAQELSRELGAKGVRTFVAGNSDALYEKAGEESLDVLVIDHQLRGFLTGLEITEKLCADCARPTTILLASEAVRDSIDVKRLRICQLESPGAAIEAIAGLTVAAAERSLLDRPFVCPRAQRLVAQLTEIQPLPPLILKIAASLRDAAAPAESWISEVAGDPLASAAILNLVNSSALGRLQKTRSVAEGIHFLGHRRTVSAVLAAGLMHAQKRLLAGVPQEVRRWHSRRGVLIASVAESFAQNLEQLPPDVAHIHGLLQDAGILVLAKIYGERYVQLRNRVEDIGHLRLEAEERNQFGTCHSDVTAALARRLGLPESLAMVLGCHHAPIVDPRRSAADQSLVRVMQIGEAVANVADRASPQRLMMLQFLLAHYQGHEAELSSSALAEAIKRVAELSEVLGAPAPDEHALAELAANAQRCDEYAPDGDFDPYRSGPVYWEPSGGESELAPPDHLPADPKPPKVLVLEDDSAIARFIGKSLDCADIEAVHATCTREALKLMRDVKAVLCDIHLGSEDGLAAISRLRSEGYAGPVIVISGDSCRSTVERALKLRISDYLLKPFSREQLIAKLRKLPGLTPISMPTENELALASTGTPKKP